MSVLLAFLWETVDTRAAAVAKADRSQVARQVLARIATELRGCVGLERIGFPIEQLPIGADGGLGTEVTQEVTTDAEGAEEQTSPIEALQGGSTVPLLRGDRRSITFLTTALPSDNQYEFYSEFDQLPPARHDLTQVSYWLWMDPSKTGDDGEPVVGGIVRTEKKTLNQFLLEEDDPLDVRHDLWSHELGYLEFRYFDGVDWDTTWDLTQGNSLPQMIQITVGFNSITQSELDNSDLDEYPIEEYPFGDDFVHPDRYSVIVRIPTADRFYGSHIERVGKQLAEQMGVEGMP